MLLKKKFLKNCRVPVLVLLWQKALIIDNNNAYPEIEQFLDESIQAAMQRFEGRKVKKDPDILPYREAFRALNILSNIVLNELDWWVASQWENMPTHYEYKTRQNFSCAIK